MFKMSKRYVMFKQGLVMFWKASETTADIRLVKK